MKISIDYICKLVELIQKSNVELVRRNDISQSGNGRRGRRKGIPFRPGYIVVRYSWKRGRGSERKDPNSLDGPLPLTEQIREEVNKEIRYTDLWKTLEHIFVDVQRDGHYALINMEIFRALASYCELRMKLIESRQPF